MSPQELLDLTRRLKAETEKVERLTEALEFIAGGSEGFAYREYVGSHGEGVSETDDAHEVARKALSSVREGEKG